MIKDFERLSLLKTYVFIFGREVLKLQGREADPKARQIIERAFKCFISELCQ